MVMRKGVSLTLADVNKKLWIPAFAKCEKLLSQLRDYSLSLTTVDQLFKGKKTTFITDTIHQLYSGVEMCRNGREVKEFMWIEGVVERMEQYWKLCQYSSTAEVFLKLRDVLKLSGNFNQVEGLADKVRGMFN